MAESLGIADNRRIAKNTMMLYIRTTVMIAVSLYTSRVVLSALGVEDYGIYTAVGGAIAMFGLISGAFSSAISRFLTFELGLGDTERLQGIFSTSVNILLLFGGIVVVLGITVGTWFLNTRMNIPTERMHAANLVWYCSLAAFVINFISVPYNAAIIAHERMSAFAYISILDAVLKLGTVFLLWLGHHDRLILYALLQVGCAAIIRLVYSIYCRRSFLETRYTFRYDKQLLRDMAGFSGWSFLTNGAHVFNTQGITVLMNLFFGIVFNAARGLAMQVDATVMQFVNSFMTALNPQITKLYAVGDRPAMFRLVCRGARFSYFLMLFAALPIFLETETVLQLWLGNPPSSTALFIRLSLIGSLFNLPGNTLTTACMATGNIRQYALVITAVGCLVFPLSWLLYRMGYPVESSYYVLIAVYAVLIGVRLQIIKRLMGFPPMMYVREVLFRIVAVTLAALLLPLLVSYLVSPTLWRLPLTTVACTLSIAASIYFVGLTHREKKVIEEKIKLKLYGQSC